MGADIYLLKLTSMKDSDNAITCDSVPGKYRDILEQVKYTTDEEFIDDQGILEDFINLIHDGEILEETTQERRSEDIDIEFANGALVIGEFQYVMYRLGHFILRVKEGDDIDKIASIRSIEDIRIVGRSWGDEYGMNISIPSIGFEFKLIIPWEVIDEKYTVVIPICYAPVKELMYVGLSYVGDEFYEHPFGSDNPIFKPVYEEPHELDPIIENILTPVKKEQMKKLKEMFEELLSYSEPVFVYASW